MEGALMDMGQVFFVVMTVTDIQSGQVVHPWWAQTRGGFTKLSECQEDVKCMTYQELQAQKVSNGPRP